MWNKKNDDSVVVAVYNWSGSVRHGLPLSVGDVVHVVEQSDGWYRGFSDKNRTRCGIFPASYVQHKPRRTALTESCQESAGDDVVAEVSQVLREWSDKWKQLYITRHDKDVSSLWKVMHELLDWRRQLVTGTLTQDQIRELRVRITAKIDWGNRQLGLDLVPRSDGVIVDPDLISLVTLHQVHSESLEMSQDMSTRGTLRKRAVRRAACHNLHVTLRDFSYSVSDDVQLYLALYDSTRSKYISERFVVRIDKSGSSNFYNRTAGNHAAIFTELGNLTSTVGVYLVIHAVRVGRMQGGSFDSSGSSSRRQHGQLQRRRYRRPLGCAVLDVQRALEGADGSGPETVVQERELTARLCQCDERDFYQLHELLIRQANKCSYITGHGNYGILLTLRVLHGSLEQLQQESPVYLKQASLVRKLGFPDIIMPGDFRNELYLSLDRGEFERGGKSTGKNVEVAVMVVRNDGRVLEDCVTSGSGEEGSRYYNSIILYHNNTPRWGENIKLAVPIDTFNGAHIRLEYSHCSSGESRIGKEKCEKKMFGFSFACLMDQDGSTVKDGHHELCVYKCEDRHRLTNPVTYLSLPWHCGMSADSTGGNHHFSRSGREMVCVSTLLCSTKLTQNIDLLSLLKWKQSPDRIVETLTKVMNLRGEEVVKFLQDVLDSLFNMFSSENGNSTPHSGLVFQVLVSIFSHLQDSKFEHFRPVVDAYVTEHFSAALVYKGLISCVRHYAEQIAAGCEKREPLVLGLRCLEFVFKFIIQSRLLFAQQSGGFNDQDFRTDLYSLFNAFNKLLSLTLTSVTGSQVALLQSIPAVFDQLRAVLPDIELARRLSLMLESLCRDPATQNITRHKLATMKAIVNSQLFQDSDSRTLLLQTMCKHVRHHLSHRQELSICTELLADILAYLHKLHQEVNVERDVNIISTYVCDTLVRCTLTTDSACASLGGGLRARLLSVLTALLRLMSPQHYLYLWDELGDEQQLAHFLHRLIALFRELVDEELFPEDWYVMRMEVNRVLLEMMTQLVIPLQERFNTAEPSNVQLLLSFMTLASSFTTQSDLQLEKFSEMKRQKVLMKYGDMRLSMGYKLIDMWKRLGEYKVHYMPSMVGPMLEVTLIPQTELRTATLPIFYDMMCVEQAAKSSFKQVETELIDKLDILVSENKGDDEYRNLFNTILMASVEAGDASWSDSARRFVGSVTRLLERLLDYRRVMDGDENRDKRMSCTVNLLNFYKQEIDRVEMYQRYIYKLHDLHVSAGSYAEAALTLRLHADQLQWTSRVLHADLLYPVQCEWQRKEQLLQQILQYLDRAKCWEAGLPLLQELIEQYETRVYDYTKLSRALRDKARFHEQILTQLRPEPEYFRVAFYGQAFPLFLRNKVFVYRGLEYERLGAFTQRMQIEFPAAQLMNKLTPPTENVMNSDVQLIQICNVRPVARSLPTSLHVEVPQKICAYFLANDVDTFQYDRPVHRGGPASPATDNEFGSLWLERSTLTTESRLPGILRWFCVSETRQDWISPVQHGCETVRTANLQLRQLTAQCCSVNSAVTAAVNGAVNQLSMRLQGIIDAAVNGGLANFQETFFAPEFCQQNPELVPHVTTLKALIQEQFSVLEQALSVHGQLAADSVQPLHRRLCQCFQQLRQSLDAPPAVNGRDSPAAAGGSAPPSCSVSRLSRHSSQRTSGVSCDPSGLTDAGSRKPSILSTPLPPVPVDKRRISGSQCASDRSSSTSSSSTFAQLVDVDDDEGIYSRPSDWPTGSGSSSFVSSGSSAGSVKHHEYIFISVGKSEPEPPPGRPPKRFSTGDTRTSLLVTGDTRTSPLVTGDRGCPSPTVTGTGEAPPLPPKPVEKRCTISTSALPGCQYENPPSLPCRLQKKGSAPSLFAGECLSEAPPLPPKLPATPPAASASPRTPSPSAGGPPDFRAPPPPSPLQLNIHQQQQTALLNNYTVLDSGALRQFTPSKSHTDAHTT